MSRSSRGFSLIDVIVGVALLLILFLALFGILRSSLTLSSLAKAKAAGIALASSQIEYMRGISYDTIGTVGGIPSGTIPQVTSSTVDGVPYTIRTYVQYADDPADGLGASDSNHITTDYKIGKVSVSYTLYGITKTITLVSNFVPQSIEAATNGGTLSIHVVNAVGANVSDATVHIVNASTTPTIDFSTFSDSSGLAVIDGAATSSQYQIYVSNPGYSSAQTYPNTASNTNPTPGYLTVVKNQTTSATFAIDRLATLVVSSFSPATTTSFFDAFSNSSNLTLNNTKVSSGDLSITDDQFSGTAQSISITPNLLTGWGILSATPVIPSNTSVLVRIADDSGTLIPDAVLSGNSAGFSSFPVSLTSIPTSTYPSITLQASMTRVSTSTNPLIHDWSLSYTTGPSPLPNISFSLTGAKTIGTDALSHPVYKTKIDDTTGASATKSESLEWDAYTLGSLSQTLIESCAPSPYQVPPASNSSVSLILGTPLTNTLPVFVVDPGSVAIPQARVTLQKTGYAATILTSACGFAYFNGLASGTYSATVSATGHATTTFSGISVSGHTATSTFTLP